VDTGFAQQQQQQQARQGREVTIQINGTEKDEEEKDLPDQPPMSATASLVRRFGSLLVGSREPKERDQEKRASILGMPMSASPKGSGDVTIKERADEKEALEGLKQHQQHSTGQTSRPHSEFHFKCNWAPTISIRYRQTFIRHATSLITRVTLSTTWDDPPPRCHDLGSCWACSST
jgi:hypothetical protein